MSKIWALPFRLAWDLISAPSRMDQRAFDRGSDYGTFHGVAAALTTRTERYGIPGLIIGSSIACGGGFASHAVIVANSLFLGALYLGTAMDIKRRSDPGFQLFPTWHRYFPARPRFQRPLL